MLNEKVAALCNEQINKEFYSAYLYLDIANYYADQGLDGFANWYTIQAQEVRPVRFRSQGSVFAQQRAGCAGLYCAVADALSL